MKIFLELVCTIVIPVVFGFFELPVPCIRILRHHWPRTAVNCSTESLQVVGICHDNQGVYCELLVYSTWVLSVSV